MGISIKDNFKKGSVEMLLLKLLSEQDMYGYEMTQAISERGQYIKVPEGSLYPTLYKLQDKGYITAYEKQIGKRMKRIYYHLNDTGKQYLEEMIAEYYAVTRCIMKILEYPNQESSKQV